MIGAIVLGVGLLFQWNPAVVEFRWTPSRSISLPLPLLMLGSGFAGAVAIFLLALVRETQWTLASAEYHERQFEQARDHAQQALNSAQGKAPEIQLLLAQALGALGQREKAAQQLESFLGSHPEHVKAPLARGWLAKLQQQGR